MPLNKRRGRGGQSLSLLALLVALCVVALHSGSDRHMIMPCVEAAAAGSTTDQQCDAADETCASNDPSAAQGSDEDCVDTHEKCAEWAEHGECLANPLYMIKSCQKSCGVCGNAGQQEQEELDAKMEELCNLKDQSDDCPRYAEETTFCSEDFDTALLRRCPESCGLCVRDTSAFGVEQELAQGEEYDATRIVIRESIKYMANIRNSDQTDLVKIRMCENKDKLCSFWAAAGECKANREFMNKDCAVACHSCELLDLARRCPMDPNAVDALYPGDLNKLFEKVTTNETYVSKYNPKIYSRPAPLPDNAPSDMQEGPWVVTFENFLSDEEVDRLLHFGDSRGYERSSDVGRKNADGSYGSLVSASRTSENAWCSEECKEDPLVKSVAKRIAEVTNTPIRNSEDLQLLRYEPGQYYVQHHDYIDHHLDRPCGVRIYTFFLYLNDICDEEDCGGGTSFPELNITVQPKKGSALLWPSVLDDKPNIKDPRTDHEALPVKKGVKYGANAWIHMRDFQATLKTNCN